VKTPVLLALVATVALAACDMDMSTPETTPGRPAVGSEYDLSSFRGARAGSAEMGVRNLGYEPIRSEGLTTWWFNRSTGACARIRTDQGRYVDVTMLPAEDC
jgi:hypothetical protein